jgi:hypothetical protein
MSEDSFENRLEIEKAGAKAGLNPVFGEWCHHFRFAPVPYGAGADRRRIFREQIQAELSNAWLFSHSIHLEIILHLDVQTVLETSDLADLDNYAKAILDGLKGDAGIMFDDTQVQALVISWLDSYGDPSFEITAKGSSGDFLLKPVAFHEMPDGLWYPHSRLVWDDGQAVELDELNHFVDLSITEMMSSVKQRARAEMRRAGASRRKAYQIGQYMSQLKRGYHRSRLEGAGFQRHERRSWQASRRDWEGTALEHAAAIRESMEGMRDSYERLIQSLAMSEA